MICRAQLLLFDPRVTQPCPIVHIFYSFAKKMAIFLHWRDKSKNLLPETKVNFFCPFFSSPFCNAGTKPIHCVLLSFLCMCEFLYNFFFFLYSSRGKGFLSLNILSAPAYFWMFFIKSQLFIHRNKVHSTNSLRHNSTCWLLSPGKVYWMYDRELFIGIEYPLYISSGIPFQNPLCYHVFGNMKGRPFNNLIPSESNLDRVERDRCQITVSVEMEIRGLCIS